MNARPRSGGSILVQWCVRCVGGEPLWSLGSPFCRSGVLPDVRVPTTGVSLSYDKCSPPMGFATALDTTISRLLPDGFRNNR